MRVGAPGSTTEHWVMVNTATTTDGASTTDNAGIDNPSGKTFTAGQIKDSDAQTGNVTLSTTEFTELEYSIAATSTAIDGQTYYFRVSNAGTAINTYTIYASATLAAVAGAPNLTQIHYRWRNDDGGEGAAGGGSGTSTLPATRSQSPDGTNTGVVCTTTCWSRIDDDPATPDGAIIYGDANEYVFIPLADMPSDFVSMDTLDTLTATLRLSLQNPRSNDESSLYLQLF